MTPATPSTPRTSPATPITPATPRTPRTSPATNTAPSTTDDIFPVETENSTRLPFNETSYPTGNNFGLCPAYVPRRQKRSARNIISIRAATLDASRRKRSSQFEDPAEKPKSRKKRLVISDVERRQWPDGIVPYVMEDGLTQIETDGIRQAIETYHRYTCMRFVPWTNVSGVTTNELLNLGHPGYIRFIDHPYACYSYVGNLRFSDGQELSCYCGETSCLHELGHATGFHHDQSSPVRDDWLTVITQNIPSYAYHNWEKFTPEEVISIGYDLYSLMHYPLFDDLRLHSPELTQTHSTHSHYYMFMELMLTQQCTAQNCSGFPRICKNDGYLSVVEGRCSCICPRGLDPETGCTTIRRPGDVNPKFPSGAYALPGPREGCPNAEIFKVGVRRHDMLDDSKIVELVTCTSDGSNPSATAEWPIGNYCIFRKGGFCPKNFFEGYIQYSHTYKFRPGDFTVAGELPDGTYSPTSTTFQFCCRNDGFAADEIFLPNMAPLELFKFGESCQNIFGMRKSEEKSFYLQRDVDEDGYNPLRYSYRLFHFEYCHYTPLDMSCGDIIHLSSSNPNVTLNSAGGNNLQCFWLITVPEGDNILLVLDELNIKSRINDNGRKECVDALEARYLRIGSPGLVFCGQTEIHSLKSYGNKLMLSFNTTGESNSSFTATAKIIPNSASCFLKSDRGQSYGGRVNYTRTFRPCVPWIEVLSCPHHKFGLHDGEANLEENYCRNPNSGLAPWCYTDHDCSRDYCDVCSNEPRFDFYSDCAERKATGYCRKYPKHANYNCAKTCADQLPVPEIPIPVSRVTCPTPTPPSDGLMASQIKANYSVGEEVTFTCRTSDVTARTVCLTTGRWSPLNRVCQECYEGWIETNGYCYGFIPRKVVFPVAQSMCAEYDGGIVATAKNYEEMLLVDKVRNLGNYRQSVWLGISQTAAGEWHWLDDGQLATWTNFDIDQPDNDGSQERNCAYMWGDMDWYEASCNDEVYKYGAVCKTKVKDVPCVDVWDDCNKLFYDQPTFCHNSLHTDVARMKCRFTCGFCDPPNQVFPECEVEPLSNNITFSFGPSYYGTRLLRGRTVAYSCRSGYVPASGNVFRGCQWCGLMTGEPYRCVYPTDSHAMAFPDVDKTRIQTVPNVAYTGNNENFRIRKNGLIVAWEYYSQNVRDIALMVWRQFSRDSFTLKGFNWIPTRHEQMMTYHVPEQEMIRVTPGDLIGIFYGNGSGGIAYEICSSYSKPEASSVQYLSLNYGNASFFSPDRTYEFNSFSSCREFAFRGVIEAWNPGNATTQTG
ncbi:hypothetical protein RRG08_034693 [Elysia crispata]|uniref:Metalloendopeptidase n=1 Tax=Elysia crispata TaxID=231223 RepID=A0AAE0Z238_9GAST|nr:hypothetical protein RRG08_034693 [Elysia crispata]